MSDTMEETMMSARVPYGFGGVVLPQGATIEVSDCDIIADAPHGMNWRNTGCHIVAAGLWDCMTPAEKAEARQVIKDGVAGGVEPCQYGADCEYCKEETR